MEALSIHLCDNPSYAIVPPPVSSEATPVPCYTPFNHLHYEYFNDITSDNIPYFQQMAVTNPNEFQLFLLVKMQKMLLEIQQVQKQPEDSVAAGDKVVYSSLSFDYETNQDIKHVLSELN